MGGTPPIRGEQDRYTFSGMPIYRDDAASLESHDRLRFTISDLESIDDRGIDAGPVEGEHGAVPKRANPVESTQPYLQDAGDAVLEQAKIEGPDNVTPNGQPCPANATYPTSNTGGDGQNGQSSSTAEPGRGSPLKRTWKDKLRAMQSTMVWREGGLERRRCQITKPLARGMRWIGKSCTCRGKDDDEPDEEPIRQGIRLVEV